MKPFDPEIWFGDRVAVLGSNGSGKSHFLRLLAAGGSDPAEHAPADDIPLEAGRHTGGSCSARACARAGSRRTTSTPSWPGGRCSRSCTAARAPRRHGPGAREQGARPVRARRAAEQSYETLSGGQQARFQILLLELGGATLLLLDEPTDNLDLHSAEALEAGLAAFEGTVLAVTHDRWFARGVRPVPRLRRGRRRGRDARAGLGRRPGPPGALSPTQARPAAGRERGHHHGDHPVEHPPGARAGEHRPQALAPKPSAVNHTTLASAAPAPNTHPPGSCWWASEPSSSTVSR